MVFEPFWLRPVKVLGLITLLVAAYAWSSADDWDDEVELAKPQYPPVHTIAQLEEPEPNPLELHLPESEPVFIPAPEGVVKKAKRAVAKGKKKIKRALAPKTASSVN
jgi:hypothetical protein